MTQGRVAESLPWVEETLDLAETTGHTDLLLAAHMGACGCYCFAGEFLKVLEHADRVRSSTTQSGIAMRQIS